MGNHRFARAIATVAWMVPSLLACATSTIDDGFTASAGVFSSTAMEDGSSGAEPPTGETMSASSTTMDPTDTDDPSDTETTDVSTTDNPSGPTTDDPTGTGDTTDDPTMTTSMDDGPAPSCGDGVVDLGEACDDGNDESTDACLPGCVAATCGDGAVYAGVETCDDGVNDGAYGGCNPGCAALAPYCGDGAITDVEMCDSMIALPYNNISCGACVYDFSAIPQLYCNGSCTWAGGDSCDQADADIYCRLVTGDPASTAISFQVLAALDQPGFSCPSLGTNLGPFPAFGVNEQVWYQDTSILANHGAGSVVANAVCS